MEESRRSSRPIGRRYQDVKMIWIFFFWKTANSDHVEKNRSITGESSTLRLSPLLPR